MLAGLKELKNWVTGMWQPWMTSEEEAYWKIEYSAERHLHNPPSPSSLSYQDEARIKSIKYH